MDSSWIFVSFFFYQVHSISVAAFNWRRGASDAQLIAGDGSDSVGKETPPFP